MFSESLFDRQAINEPASIETLKRRASNPCWSWRSIPGRMSLYKYRMLKAKDYQ